MADEPTPEQLARAYRYLKGRMNISEGAETTRYRDDQVTGEYDRARAATGMPEPQPSPAPPTYNATESYNAFRGGPSLDALAGAPRPITAMTPEAGQMTHLPEATHPDQEIARSIMNVFGGAASEVAGIPKRIIQSSESMRQGGDYDPAPAVEAASLATPLGAEMSGGRALASGLRGAAKAAPKTTAGVLGGAGAAAATSTAAPGADKPNPKLGEINQLQTEISALSDKLTGLSTVKMQSTKAREIASGGIQAQIDAKTKRMADLQQQVKDDEAMDKAIEEARLHSQLAFNEKYAPWSHIDFPLDALAGGFGGNRAAKYFKGQQTKIGEAWDKAIKEANTVLKTKGMSQADPKVKQFIAELEGHKKRGIPYGPWGVMGGGAMGGVVEGAFTPIAENIADVESLPADSPAGKQARANWSDPSFYAGKVLPYAAVGAIPGGVAAKYKMQKNPVVAPKPETEGTLAGLRALPQTPPPPKPRAPSVPRQMKAPPGTAPRLTKDVPEKKRSEADK